MDRGKTRFEQRFRKLMYISMVINILLVVFPIAYSYFTTTEIYAVHAIEIDDGIMDLTAYELDEVRPFELSGEWNSYESVYFEGESVDYEELGTSTITTFPIRNLLEAMGTSTYQLYIKMDLDDAELAGAALSITFPTDTIRVYINGIYVEGYYPLVSWSGFDSEYKVYPFADNYDASSEYQEILISVNENSESTDLYNRDITISTVENTLGMAKMMFLIQGMLVAMMFFSVLSGVVYTLFLPTYSVLTIMNLFDTALMLHLFFNMCTLPQVIMDTVTLGTIGDILFRQLDLFFLFLAGILGNTLTALLYDKERYYGKLFMAPINIAFAILMVWFGCFPKTIDSFGMVIAIAVLIWSFIGIVLKIQRNYKMGTMGGYQWFHVVKTVCVGALIFTDLVTINQSGRPEGFLAISYTLFFLIHMVVRAVEYRAPYLKIAENNENLEQLVAERTQELLEANNVLREISIIDPLTGAYNRMYFDEEFMKAIDNYNTAMSNVLEVHICIIDLDNFKSINDTYGHQVGDVQLIEAIKQVRRVVNGNVIISRIGGEEFTLLFINYTDECALATIEEVRRIFELEAEAPERTTGSFGVTKASQGVKRKELFAKADRCLYYAKNQGKNQVAHDFTGDITRYVSNEYKGGVEQNGE